jgi:hypothetical protein
MYMLPVWHIRTICAVNLHYLMCLVITLINVSDHQSIQHSTNNVTHNARLYHRV